MVTAMKKIILLLIFSLFFVSSLRADKDNESDDNDKDKCGELSVSPEDIKIDWTESFRSAEKSFRVQRTKSNKKCRYYVTFSAGGGTFADRRAIQGSYAMKYQVYKSASLEQKNILKELPTASNSDEVVTGEFPDDKKENTSKYYLEIPIGAATSPTLVKSGLYMDTYSVKVYPGQIGDDSKPDNTRSVLLSILVPKIIRISLVGTGQSFRESDTTESLDFGTLEQGKSKSFDLKVVTNAGFQVRFSSQNNGVLKQGVGGADTTVPYTLKVNSVTRDLSGSQGSPVVVAEGTGQSSLDGKTNQVSVTIGDVENKVAGEYSDIILVTATTIE